MYQPLPTGYRRYAFHVLLVTLGVWLLESHAALAQSGERPNIIVILSDDMGFSDIGCYGGEIATPTLDDLAESGVRFTQFYNTGRCCPTRASLLSGLYPHQAGVGWMMTDRGYEGYQGELNRRCVTIAEVLRSAGYATYMSGKWHVTQHVQPTGPKDNWPLQRGFDRFYGTITGAGSFFDPGTLTRDNTMLSPFADPEYQPKQYYYTDAISDHAVRFVDEHQRDQKDKPFFMYVAYTAAHWPMHALPEDIQKYSGKYDQGYAPVRQRRLERARELGLISDDWQLSEQHGGWDQVEHKEWEARCMEVYAAMVDRMDQGIGRIVETLKENGQFDNTLILFMQDNGGCQEGNGRRGDWKRPVDPSLPKIAADAIRLDVVPRQNRAGVPTLTGPHIMPGPEDTYIAYGIDWANVSNTPFREYKHFVHEGGISTPLIAHWPRGIGRDTRITSQPGHLIDVMATCVDVAGAEYPSEFHDGQQIRPMEGVSLAPAMRGESLGRSEPLFWEHEGNRAIRDGRWKLVAKENKPWELYDMQADRTETVDLSASHPDVVRKLEQQWDAWAERADVLPLGAWRGNPKQQSFNRKQKRFDLQPNADLDRSKAPYVADRGFRATVEFEQWGSDGVLLAQGGSAEGFALYLQDGHLKFATRHHGTLTILESESPLPKQARSLVIQLADDGTVEASMSDGVNLLSGRVPGPLSRMPIDGLQVGQDSNGAVGNYASPHAFTGKLRGIRFELE